MLHGRGGAVNRVMGGFAGLATQTTRQVADERITHRTGNYRRSIKAELVKPDRVHVSAAHPPALFLEGGTRPHRIDSPVLIPGVGWRFIGLHPGTRPYHILRDGTRRAGAQLNRLSRRG